MIVKVKNHGEYVPVNIEKGDWIDLATKEDITLKAGEIKIIPLGVSMKLPEGHTAYVLPRSSTPLKYGILMANSMGVIDESYCGDNDEWGYIAYAIKDTTIPKGTRIAQFTIAEKKVIHLEFVDELVSTNRGGFGSTGN